MILKLLCLILILYIEPILAIESESLTHSTIDEDKSAETSMSDAADRDNLQIKNPTGNELIHNMLVQSMSLIGIAYRWGGNTPDSGMDCSGFVRYVFKHSLGIDLPRTASQMSKVGKRIGIKDIQPGDLMFFNTNRGSNTHIGIFLGNNNFIQSPSTGTVVQITAFKGWWQKHFNGAKRIAQETVDDKGNSQLSVFDNIHNEGLPTIAVHTQYYRKKRTHHIKHSHQAKHVSRLTTSHAAHKISTKDTHAELKHSHQAKHVSRLTTSHAAHKISTKDTHAELKHQPKAKAYTKHVTSTSSTKHVTATKQTIKKVSH